LLLPEEVVEEYLVEVVVALVVLEQEQVMV
jgi:hypothetical protein